MDEGRGIYSVAMFHVGASYVSLAPTFLQKAGARSCRCSFSPNRARCVGLRFGFLREPQLLYRHSYQTNRIRTYFQSVMGSDDCFLGPL